LPVLKALFLFAPRLSFPIHTVVLSGEESFPIAGVPGLFGACTMLAHEIPCLGYALTVPRAPRFDPDRAWRLGVPQPLWKRLQRGETVEHAGGSIAPEAVLGPPRRGLRVVLATDTHPVPQLPDFVDGADLFIADAMYGEEVDKPKRWDAQHLTFAESATIARDGGARRLWLTHFSPALSDPAAHLPKATAIFPATTLGRDGLKTTLSFDD
jgi:ribonuclease Z